MFGFRWWTSSIITCRIRNLLLIQVRVSLVSKSCLGMRSFILSSLQLWVFYSNGTLMLTLTTVMSEDNILRFTDCNLRPRTHTNSAVVYFSPLMQGDYWKILLCAYARAEVIFLYELTYNIIVINWRPELSLFTRFGNFLFLSLIKSNSFIIIQIQRSLKRSHILYTTIITKSYCFML